MLVAIKGKESIVAFRNFHLYIFYSAVEKFPFAHNLQTERLTIPKFSVFVE